MSDPIPIPERQSDSLVTDGPSSDTRRASATSSGESLSESTNSPSSPYLSGQSPRLSRNPSFSSSSYQEDWEAFPPLDRLTVFDLLENFALPQQIEKLQNVVSAQTKKVQRQRDALKTRSHLARERVVDEWRKRVPTAEEQLEKYMKRMRESVDQLGRRWNDTKGVTLREKFSFIFGVLNIFISGYLIGGFPQYFHIWYTVQLLYFMPLRAYTYHKRGYHYFLADLCYFVNLLLLLSMWIFPNSKRLFISTYCLAFGNNAVAIAMWRNSLVFHSLDKVTSLFIHMMPCVALHCIVHLLPDDLQEARFPAVHTIRTAPVGDPRHYSLFAMTMWSTVPYAIWQLLYHFLITVRRRDKIAAGRPTSFTWLRKSYSKAWIGRMVISLPESLQEPAFMLIQYSYAVLTMLPCPIWFSYRYASAAFLSALFSWSIYNGATYYIDVFGKRFQNELEAMKLEIQRWHNSPVLTPEMTANGGITKALDAQNSPPDNKEGTHARNTSVDKIPLLNEEKVASSTGIDGGVEDVARERKIGDLPA